VLVEQEHRHPRDLQQLVDLRRTGPRARLGVAVGRGLPDAVRLVAEQHVELVRLELAELVEVPEHRLHPRRPLPGHLAQRLGER
jgi:hypothetical protein